MKAIRNRFKAGSGVFTCRICSYRTRDTGDDNTDLTLCFECYELSGYENAVSDGNALSDNQIRNVKSLEQQLIKRGSPVKFDILHITDGK